MAERKSIEHNLMKEYTFRQRESDRTYFKDGQSFTEGNSEFFTCSYNMCFETMNERTIKSIIQDMHGSRSYVGVIAIEDYKRDFYELNRIRNFMNYHANNVKFSVLVTQNTDKQLIFVLAKNKKKNKIKVTCDKSSSRYAEYSSLCMCIELEMVRFTKRLCVLAVYLKSGQDIMDSLDKPLFLTRFRELYSIVHKCNTWWKTHIIPSNPYEEKEFMDFNCLIIGDMNSNMIDKINKSTDTPESWAFDEMQIIIPTIGFEETKRRFRATYKLDRNDHGMYENTEEKSWPDRVFYHNGDVQLKIQAVHYTVIEGLASLSQHLPVIATFNLVPCISTWVNKRVPLQPQQYNITLDRHVNPFTSIEPSKRPILKERAINRLPKEDECFMRRYLSMHGDTPKCNIQKPSYM